MKKMKRTLPALLMVLCLLVGSLIWIAAELWDASDDVVLTEEVLFGDRKAAEGLRVQLTNTYENSLLWVTDITIGEENVSVTDFSYHNQYDTPSTPIIYEGIMLHMDYGNVFDFYPMQENTGIGAEYQELYESIKLYGHSAKQIRLKDYMDEYPLRLQFHLPKSNPPSGWDSPVQGTGTANRWQEIQDALLQYFAIPIETDSTVIITLSMDEDGVSTTYESTALPFIETVSTTTEDAIYLAFNYTANADMIHPDSVGEGHGLYRIPLDRNAEGADRIRVEEIARVQPLEAGTEIHEILDDPYSDNLLMVTDLNDAYSLVVLDGQTGGAKQVIPMGEIHGYMLHVRDGFAVFATNDTIWVLALNADGTYTITSKIIPTDEFPYASKLLVRSINLAYDGKRLAVVSQGHWEVGCGFSVLVFENDTLAACLRYTCSLSPTCRTPYFCNPLDHFSENCVGVIWEE